MILCFPPPFPDELLYSICARYSDRMEYPAKETALKELFGKGSLIAIADLPKNLEHLCASLPQETYYTFDALVNHHTLLPLYAPFLSVKQLQNLLEEMHYNTGRSGMHFRVGLTSKSFALPQWLRFCPHCAKEDRVRYGECYWHRTHQAPGVEVCPIHEVYLQNSSVKIRDNNWGKFISAESVVPHLAQSISAPTGSDREALVQIAHDASWLLNQPNSKSQLDFIHSQYRALLSDLHLATYQGILNINKLTVAFSAFYSPALLRRLQCELNVSGRKNWLIRFLREPYPPPRPVQHLLLMQFLRYSAEDFFKLPTERKPFGNGPWPCLNVACQHYHQLRINKFDLTYSHSSRTHGRPIGIFACECGFVYSRLGPDKSPSDLFNKSSVLSYGVVWEAKLGELCKDETMTERSIARELGVVCTTVQRQAIRLQLSYSKGKPRGGKPRGPEQEKQLYNLWKERTYSVQDISQQLGIPVSKVRRIAMRLGIAFGDSRRKPSPLKKEEHSHVQDFQMQEEERSAWRLAWISAVRANPGAGTRALKERIPRVYDRLYYHDREWLREHSPRWNGGKPGHAPYVDWKSRDVQLAEAVRSSAQQLREAPGKPVWITSSSIRKSIGGSRRLYLVLEKLPLTAQALAEVVEKREQLALRRIRWTVELYLQEGLCPGRRAFIRRAGVRNSAERPEVEEAINAALQRVAERLSQAFAAQVLGSAS